MATLRNNALSCGNGSSSRVAASQEGRSATHGRQSLQRLTGEIHIGRVQQVCRKRSRWGSNFGDPVTLLARISELMCSSFQNTPLVLVAGPPQGSSSEFKRQPWQSRGRGDASFSDSDLDWTWSMDGSSRVGGRSCDQLDTSKINSVWNSLVSATEWESSNQISIQQTGKPCGRGDESSAEDVMTAKYFHRKQFGNSRSLPVNSLDSSQSSEAEWVAEESNCSHDDDDDEVDGDGHDYQFSGGGYQYCSGPRWVKSTMKAAGKESVPSHPNFFHPKGVPKANHEQKQPNFHCSRSTAFESVDLPVAEITCTGDLSQHASGAPQSIQFHHCGEFDSAGTNMLTTRSSWIVCSQDLRSRNRDSVMIEAPGPLEEPRSSGWERFKRGFHTRCVPACLVPGLDCHGSRKVFVNEVAAAQGGKRSKSSIKKSFRGYCKRQQYLVNRIEESIK